MEQLKPIHLPLELVLNIITCSLPKANVLLAPSHPITQLLLSFTLVCKETCRVARRCLLQHCVYLSSEARLSSYLLTISTRPQYRTITALFLAPFGNTIDNQPTATWVRELFNYTCTTLKRLIIDIPLRSLYPEDDHLGVRRILHQGFKRLENLEELVSVRDELYLSLVDVVAGEPAFWTFFPKLRRLAVYNPDISPSFWRDISKMEKLETLVLTRADGIRSDSNFKTEYFAHCDRNLKVLLVNVDDDQVRYGNMRRHRWNNVDPKKKMTISTYTIPLFMDDDAIEVCQDYIRIGSEYGTLWDWEGEIIPHPPIIVQLVASGA
ncbi:hypothetical protein P280DRAFT_471980 [Massarina eburnea CBS 473.64]|uniref:F-box domain-containing protein n=1 Tax=Massarina eburnea CBS 473.64 TaxID=1395130 RepID=A0A6A6RTV9_9PLEO|nr:hypothetical protein P280DRAFT_471980 [Massarina eburnea CBS 473.64]